jgi:hypothetical protein
MRHLLTPSMVFLRLACPSAPGWKWANSPLSVFPYMMRNLVHVAIETKPPNLLSAHWNPRKFSGIKI